MGSGPTGRNPAATEPGQRRWRYTLLWVVGAFLLAGGAIGALNLVFYARWLRPNQPIPEVPRGAADQRSSPDLAAAMAEDFRVILRDSRENAGLPSMSAAIGFEGAVKWAGAVGYSDIEERTTATVRSRYPIASVSKALTGVLLVRLVEAGLLEMDAPVSSYLPGLPAHLMPLTARQLSSHLGGVRHYSMPALWLGWWEVYSTRDFGGVEEGLSLFRDDKLRFVPGTDFLYSTFGYSLLSRQMEVASGEDFPLLLRNHLALPARMCATEVDRAGGLPERVTSYTADSGIYTRAIPINTSYKMAGGGMVSTPTDLVQLGVTLLGDGFLSDAARHLLWTPAPLADASPNPGKYATGWRVDTSVHLLDAERPLRILHHGGMQPGGSAFFMVVPERGIAVASVANSGTNAARAAVQELSYALVRRAIEARGAFPGGS